MCDKVVCDKVVCDKVVCDKVVCDKVVCDKVVCDKVVCDKVVRDKVVCDKFVCDKFVSDKVVCDKVVCDKVVGDKEDAEEEAEEGYAGGCQSKNKSPTQFCGEQCFLKSGVATYQKLRVLAKKCPPSPRKPVPYSCLCHLDDHALSTFGAGGLFFKIFYVQKGFKSCADCSICSYQCVTTLRL